MGDQYGFHFDAKLCTGCKTCMLACKDYCNLDSASAYRQVYEMQGGGWTVLPDGTLQQDCFAYYVSLACNHCARPACMEVCPTGAMHRGNFGLVSVDERRCIGCGYCALSCPYHAPKVDRLAGIAPSATGARRACERARRPSAWRRVPCARSISAPWPNCGSGTAPVPTFRLCPLPARRTRISRSRCPRVRKGGTLPGASPLPTCARSCEGRGC